jgi:hypothetical protein
MKDAIEKIKEIVENNPHSFTRKRLGFLTEEIKSELSSLDLESLNEDFHNLFMLVKKSGMYPAVVKHICSENAKLVTENLTHLIYLTDTMNIPLRENIKKILIDSVKYFTDDNVARIKSLSQCDENEVGVRYLSTELYVLWIHKQVRYGLGLARFKEDLELCKKFTENKYSPAWNKLRDLIELVSAHNLSDFPYEEYTRSIFE